MEKDLLFDPMVIKQLVQKCCGSWYNGGEPEHMYIAVIEALLRDYLGLLRNSAGENFEATIAEVEKLVNLIKEEKEDK